MLMIAALAVAASPACSKHLPGAVCQHGGDCQDGDCNPESFRRVPQANEFESSLTVLGAASEAEGGKDRYQALRSPVSRYCSIVCRCGT